MNCEITLYKLNNFKIQNNLISEGINLVTEYVIDEVFESNQYFTFYKTKK